MSLETLSMRKISEVLRLGLGHKLPLRQVARGCNLARSTVADYLGRARVAGLSWPLPPDMTEARLDALLFPVKQTRDRQSMPPMVYLRHEMRLSSVTLQLLWEEYRRNTPDGYGYSQFCQLYRDWLGTSIDLSSRHSTFSCRSAFEGLFVDCRELRSKRRRSICRLSRTEV